MGENHRMTTAERRSIILRKLEENDQVNVVDLSKIFHVSEVTIRNDLGSLEEKNLLVRARGGAIKASVINRDVKLSEKNKKNLKEKKAIAKLAATLIKDGDTVLIDSGSTTEEIAKELVDIKELTIVTNALNIVSQFTDNPDITVIVPGGILRHSSFSLAGNTSEQNLNEYYCDKVLLGVDAIDVRHGIFTPHIEEANLNRAMIRISQEVIVVTDSSKFNKRSLTKIADITAVHTIVTDSGLTADLRKILEDQGIRVIIAEV
ncbi:MAG TPA: transcriptional repressor AgaR [Cytophagaceae bacterium]|jgi:DeoR family transcriptional regulator of aga operon|nr:transcriptional repressor AgaR [Cytophagaceae bacterium]